MKDALRCALLCAALIVAALPLCAQEDEEIRKHPGYVDFSSLPIPSEGEETVEVYLRGPLLRLVARASGDDPSLARMLSKLLLIRVNSFSVDTTLALALQPKLAKIESDLTKRGWEKVVRVKDRKGEAAHIYLKLQDSKILGLLVMAVEPGGDAAFVNIVGEIDMEATGDLGKKLDIPALEGVKDSAKPK